MPCRSSISFVQDFEIKTIRFDVEQLRPTTTVLNYLRSSAIHKGTKEGCAEGDCGACTVVLGELNVQNKIIYTAIDSCLVFLPMLHGKQLITVENLSEAKDKEIQLHPVQQAMVDHNGSQCGYCTPGIVMSLFALYKQVDSPSKENTKDALTGNLCRCTGYKSIIEATSASCVYKGMDHFSKSENDVLLLLMQIKNDERMISIKNADQVYDQPASLTEALKLKSDYPDALIINGSTDVALRVTKKHELLPHIIDLSAVKAIKGYEKNKTEIIIGAGLNLEEIKMRTESDLPALFTMLKVFGSRQIRSLATLGGNVGSASPIGDTIPVLMGYNAIVHLQSVNGKRAFNISEFISGYRQTKRNSDELITAISIPVPEKTSVIKSYKISKRKDLDISTLNACFRITLKDEMVEDILLTFGGMAATTKRAMQTENYLKGKPWNRKTVEEAVLLLDNEFTPISDARSGAAFRKIAAKNLLIKFWSETSSVNIK